MERPIISENGKTLTMSLEWFLNAVMAVDRESYSCGGICRCSNAADAYVRTVSELIKKDGEELKKYSR